MPEEPRTAEPPEEFDTYELVILRRPEQPPALDDATRDLLQSQHLGHFANMKDAGHLKASGPLRDQPDDTMRGICLYQVGSIAEARRLAELDPAVAAGVFTLDVMTWLTPKGALNFVVCDGQTDRVPAWSLRDLEPVIRAAWAEDTCDPVDLPWSRDNPSRGQCGVTALVLHDLLGGELLCADVLYADGTQQGWHYWNRLPDGVEVDLTREQFAATELLQTPVVVTPPQEAPWRCAEQYFLLRERVLAHLDRSGSADRDEFVAPDH